MVLFNRRFGLHVISRIPRVAEFIWRLFLYRQAIKQEQTPSVLNDRQGDIYISAKRISVLFEVFRDKKYMKK